MKIVRAAFFAVVVGALAACGGDGGSSSDQDTVGSDDVATAKAALGEGCTSASDCETGACWEEQPDYNIGGYCSKDCAAAPCPLGSVCVKGSTSSLCLKFCTGASDCKSGQDCLAEGVNACVPVKYPGGRHYAFAAGGRVTDQDGNGEAWDALGGAPDVGVTLWVDGAAVYTEQLGQDTFDWSVALSDIEVTKAATVIIEVWDSDLTENDSIGSVDISKAFYYAYFFGDASISGGTDLGMFADVQFVLTKLPQ